METGCPGQNVPGTQGIPGASPGQRGGPTARCDQTRGPPGLDEQACRGHPRRIMLNPFGQPELIKAEVFTSLPAKFRARGRTAWSDPNRQGAEVDSFLEGPSFDRAGNLYVVDIPF